MTDLEFLHAFESGRISPADFHHRDHLRLAWVQIGQLGAEGAAAAVASDIRRFAEEHGHHRLYHETLTRFWVRIVAHCAQPTFVATLARHPMLLSNELPLHHWNRDMLFSQEARAAWVEPDLLPLP